LRRKLFGDTERRLPSDVSGRGIDCGQPAPWRFLTGPVLISDTHIESVSAGIGFLIRKRCAVAGFLHPAERAHVLRRHEDIARTWTERGPPPLRAAESSWKEQSRRRPVAVGAERPRREWPRVLNTADLVDEFLARLRVFGRGVCGGHQIHGFVAHASGRGRFYRDWLGWKSRVAGY